MTMLELFQNLDPTLKAFWSVALVSSLIFLIQTIMTFVGMDAADGVSADFHGDANHDGNGPFQLFSFRNLINFLLGFSWTGITFYDTISSKVVLMVIAVMAGVGMVALFAYLISLLHGLAEDNSFNIADTVGLTAQVYLFIPATKSGKGIIQVSVKGSVHELDALTAGDRIETGAMVRVTAVVDNNLLMVEKI
ncbi:MAG: serine protease [Saprospiraceae bacterium]